MILNLASLYFLSIYDSLKSKNNHNIHYPNSISKKKKKIEIEIP